MVTPGTAQVGIARLVISGAFLIGVALVGSRWWIQDTSKAAHNSTVKDVAPAARQTNFGHSVSPGLGASRLETEAETIKKEAVVVAGQVALAYPNDALTYALLGSAYYNTGQSDEATKYLRRCLELRSDQLEAYEILARLAYDKGDLEETLRLCQEALKHGPATPDVLNRLGRAQIDLGHTAEAVRTLQQAVQLPKPDSESCYLLGQAYMQSDEFARAKEVFQLAIKLLPDHTQAYFGLYTACLRLGLTEEATRYREQFQKLESNDRKDLTDRNAREDTLTGLPMVRETVARTLFGAAQIYLIHEQFEKAAELFRRSATLDPNNPVYRSALESLYVQRNNLKEGIRVFEQLAAEQPENSLNFMFLGRLQSREENFEASERAFRKVQQLTPKWVEGYRAMAELYLRTHRKTDQARILAGKVIELEPNGSNYYLLAVACLKNNERAGALEAVKKAIALSPGETKYQQLFQQLQSSP